MCHRAGSKMPSSSKSYWACAAGFNVASESELTCHHWLPHAWPVHVGKGDEDDEAKHMKSVEHLRAHFIFER